MWRRHTFVNCWTSSEHESHALWRIYRSSEAVAIQTTFGGLKESVSGLKHSLQSDLPRAVFAVSVPSERRAGAGQLLIVVVRHVWCYTLLCYGRGITNPDAQHSALP